MDPVILLLGYIIKRNFSHEKIGLLLLPVIIFSTACVPKIPAPTPDKTVPVVTESVAIETANTNRPKYTFNTTEAGIITYGGACSSKTTTATQGNTFNRLSENTYDNCTIQVTDNAGNTSLLLQINSFTIDIAHTITVNVDKDNNSTTDEIHTIIYDSNGNLLSNTIDSNIDGVADSIVTYTYDSNGNRLTQSSKRGTTKEIFTYTYDNNSNPLTLRIDTEAYGIFTWGYVTMTFTYDSNGNLLTESTYNYGTYGQFNVYTYDSNGNRLTESIDDNDDGVADSIATYTYDSNGNLLTVSTDNNGDDATDSIATYTYDSNSNLLTESFDNNADGAANLIIIYTYDSNSNLLTQSTDSNGDGVANWITRYIYDGNGNLLTYSIDDNADGTPDKIHTHIYSY